MKKLLLLIACKLLILNTGYTQWQQVSNGIYGGVIQCLTADSTTDYLYAAAGGSGIFLSTDNGSTWSAVNNGLISNNYYQVRYGSIAISGSNIFAGSMVGGVFLSTNNGSSWTAVNNGLTNLYVYTIAISGSNIFAGTDEGIFVSTNNGSSWTAVNNGLTNLYVRAITTSGSNIFAGTDEGIFLSNNNGSSWNAVNNGLTNQDVSSIAISGSNIFAGTQGGVFLSNNNGTNWTAINNGLTNHNVNIIVSSGSNIFVGTERGIFMSTNNGSNWTDITNNLTIGQYTPQPKIYSIAINRNEIFVGTFNDEGNSGVFSSSDNGSSWKAVNDGIVTMLINSIKSNGSDIFAGTPEGIYLSTNNGSNWIAKNNGIPISNVLSIALKDSTVFAGGVYLGVAVSTNNGNSWTSVIDGTNGLTNIYVRTIAISDNNIFAGTFGGGVFLSTNNGSTWTTVNNGLTDFNIWTMATSGSNIYAGTEDGIFLSTNNGNSWTAVNNGLPETWLVETIAISGDNIYAGIPGRGIYISTNNGSSWQAMNNGLTNLSVTSIVTNDSNIFAGTYGGGIFFSTNNGNSWKEVNNIGLSSWEMYIYSLEIIGSYIFTGTAFSGIWSSLLTETTYTVTFAIADDTDPIQGAIITLTSYGTKTTDAKGLASFSDVLPEDDIGYTVTATGYNNVTGTVSVVDADVNENITLISVTSISDLSESQIKFYPNPVNDIGIFTYPIGQDVQIKIYDTKGVLIKIIHDRDLNGKTEFTFSEYGSGLYIYRLIDGNGIVYNGKVMKE